MVIKGVYYRYYEHPYKKIEELLDMVSYLQKRVERLEESEKHYKDIVMNSLVKQISNSK